MIRIGNVGWKLMKLLLKMCGSVAFSQSMNHGFVRFLAHATKAPNVKEVGNENGGEGIFSEKAWAKKCPKMVELTGSLLHGVEEKGGISHALVLKLISSVAGLEKNGYALFSKTIEGSQLEFS